MTRRFILGVAILLCTAQGWAAELNLNMRATADLALHAAPPKGLLNASGRTLRTVTKGTLVYAKECMVVKDLFGSYNWYEVQLPAPDGKSVQTGWVYTGNPGSTNFLQSVPGKTGPVCH